MEEVLSRTAHILRQGGVVAIPTETYYGLAADPFCEEALKKIFILKQRPLKKPLLTIINDISQLQLLVAEIPLPFHNLMTSFWPGPLTLIFPARPSLSSLLTAGTATIGVRLSSHPIARELLRSFGGPLTATSANISGQTPAVSVLDLKVQFGQKLDGVIDGGTLPGACGSTIVGYDGRDITIIRAGVIPTDRIRGALHREAKTP